MSAQRLPPQKRRSQQGQEEQPSCALLLPEDTYARVMSAAAVLRQTPEDFIAALLKKYRDSLGGLPRALIVVILSYLDYSTVSAVISRVCKPLASLIQEEPSHFFSKLRQMHGVHMLDPARGVFYFPRALRRVMVGAGAAASVDKAKLQLPGDRSAPASSFLTVDIRTQDTRALPWSNVKQRVRQAVEEERLLHGVIRTPSLQRLEEPVFAQAAVVNRNRHIYCFGGESYEGVVMSFAYDYNPATKRWDQLPSMRHRRAAACAAAFGQKIFVFGGYNAEEGVLQSYEVLDLVSRTWEVYTTPTSASSKSTPARHATEPHRTFFDTPGRTSEGETGRGNTRTAHPSTTSVAPQLPQKVFGATVTRCDHYFVLIGGFQERINPNQVAISSSVNNSEATTTAQTPQRQTNPDRSTTGFSLSPSALDFSASTTSEQYSEVAPPPPRQVDPSEACTFVWVFCPRSRQWYTTETPSLPSPRAFGGALVLTLPFVGRCLCYFGGCAKASQPETTMLYIPLAEHARFLTSPCPCNAAASPRASPRHRYMDELEVEALVIAHIFRDVGALPWHSYARVPLGGAHTSVAVMGMSSSPSLVLSSFYPAPFIGYCKVEDLIAYEVLESMSPALASTAARDPGGRSPLPDSAELLLPPATLQLDVDALAQQQTAEQVEQQEAARQWRLERERGQQQRREMRQLMRSAAAAASLRRPLDPCKAGEAFCWNLAPLTVVRDTNGNPSAGMTWQVQAANAKVVVGIE